MRRRPRVVVDTGVLVSGYAFGGVPEQALKAVLRSADLYVSPELLAEYRDVADELRTAGKLKPEQFRALVAGVAAFVSEARVVNPTAAITLCRDPKDDMVLECCHAARAAFLVTGDRDLLALADDVANVPGLRRLRILTPRSFVHAVASGGARRR